MMKEIKICRKCTWLKVYKYICECTKETCRLFRVGGGTDAQHPELAPPRNTWGGGRPSAHSLSLNWEGETSAPCTPLTLQLNVYPVTKNILHAYIMFYK